MLMIEEISKDSEDYIDGKVGHRYIVNGSIATISLEFYLLAKHIIKILDEYKAGFLFKGYVEELLPLLLNNVGDFKSITEIISRATDAMVKDGGNDA